MAIIWTVEDEETISVLLVNIIKSMGHEPVHCYDGTELALLLEKGVPDLLLLDLMLRGRNGYQILADWKAQPATRDIPVIILSARSTETDKVKGLDLGAEDYVTKPFSVRELKARINTALRRITPAPARLEFGSLVLVPDQRLVEVEGQPITLTTQEFELLHYLAKHAGQLVSRAQLLADVWGYQSQTESSRTVDYHVRVLRKKLGDDASKPRFIETVHGGGYRLLAVN